MTGFAICFDFPETGDPWFAGLVGGAFGFTSSLDDALRWDDETAAINALRNAYGDETRQFGVVVEVGA